MQLYESGEMYLETIFMLMKAKDGVHAVDVAKKLGVSRPSVSNALSKLQADRYITVDGMDHIQFTEKGLKQAERIYDRHMLFTAFLISLGVSRENAEADACKMEHDLSDETCACIRAFLEKKEG